MNVDLIDDAPVEEVDVLVIGGGAAGLASAVFASSEGFDVLVCEKSDQVGGTAATSAGTVWVPGSTQAKRSGMANSLGEAARFLAHETQGLGGAELRRAYLETAPHAIDYLEENSDLKFQAISLHPDYHDGPGSTTGGRPLSPVEFDGRLLKEDFDLIRPPIAEFMLFGGMMVAKQDIVHLLSAFRSPRSAIHSLKLLVRYGLDRLRYKRGTRLVMGNAFVARLFYTLRRRQNVSFWFKASPMRLIQEGQRVAGAVVSRDGKIITVRARRGVILASGGFPAGKALREELIPARMAQHDSLAFPGNVGDGLRLAREAGGDVETQHGAPLFHMPVSIMKKPDGSVARYPHVYLDRAKPGLIAVNGRGERFANEANSYHDFVAAMLADETAIPAYLICGGDFIYKYGLGLIYPRTRKLKPYLDAGYLRTADTLSALAEQINVDAGALERTVRLFNADASTGVDRAFGRGSSELNKFNGDPSYVSNPCVAPVAGPPYYAVAVWPSDIGCSLGIRTDENGSVLAETGVVENLYACGNDMNSVMRGTYPGPGITLGPAVTFAYRAIMHAAGKPHIVGQNEFGITDHSPYPEPEERATQK